MNPRLAVQPTLGSPEPEHAARVFLSDLADGDGVSTAFAVRERSRLSRRNGDDFVKLILGDRTGTVEAVAWEEVDECFECSEPGAIVWVEGRFTIHARYGPKITIDAIRSATAGEYGETDLVESSPIPIDLLETDLRDLLSTIRDPQLSELLDRFLGEGTKSWERFRVAPAAKYYHQAYTHGLLEHALSVAQAVSAAAAAFPGIDRDLAVTGALLHDLGKTQAYNSDPFAIDLTDVGRLLGEIPIGYYLVRREIESIEGFDPELAQAVLHIILAHHGTHEMGSPVVPATREATLVHMMDNLGGKLGSFDRIERDLGEGQAWSKFDRGLDSAAYFPSRRAA
jgi:3'-5' exoribonuclease